MILSDITCTNCQQQYPEVGLPAKCPLCGGLYDYRLPWSYDPALVNNAQPGIWRYRFTFSLPETLQPVSLGEGGTPLLWAEAFGRQIAFKCEYQNPTGSFKDRGSAVIVGWLQYKGISEVVEDSSGNAGASLAAYAARAGIKVRIYMPDASSGPKRGQIENLGAELYPVSGIRSEVADAVARAAGGGMIYASHAYLPFNIPGYATAAYEIYNQLGNKMPGAVIVPVGQGGLFLGLWRGFMALKQYLSGTMAQKDESGEAAPVFVGVQAKACAPLWAVSVMGPMGLGFVAENPTLAEGVRIRYPVRGDAVLQVTAGHKLNPDGKSSNLICAVDEANILPGREALARLGFWVEPTSAIVWNALEQTIASLPDPVVVLLTGSGYKYR